MRPHSSSSDGEESGNSAHLQLCGTAAEAFPRHWDFVKVHRSAESRVSFILSYDRIVSELQPEYWWRNNISSTSCFKQLWLAYNGLADDRNELTEYQIVREVIWSLLGARSSYIFRVLYDPEKLLNNRVVTSKRASLASLPYTTLDSLLDIFARFATNNLILHVCIQFIAQSAAIVHPCILAFGMCLDDYLADFARYLQILQSRSRGPHNFTLTKLHFSLLSWSRRANILATLLTQLTAGYVSRLMEGGAHIYLLDLLYHANISFSDCCTDASLLELLTTSFFRAFSPYLFSTIHLLSGNVSFHDCISCLFIKTESDINLADPAFWKQTFLHSATSGTSFPLAQTPRFFLPILSELVSALRALCVLTALSEHAPHLDLLKSVAIEPATILSTITKSLFNNDKHLPTTVSNVRLSTNPIVHTNLRTELLASVLCYGSTDAMDTAFLGNERQSRTPTLESLQTTLKTFVRTRCALLNRHLVNLLIATSPLTNFGFRSLGDALAAVGTVYLFGAGDRMNDFARHLFSSIKVLEPWYLDLAGLTLCLRSQFGPKLVPSFMSSESTAFTFVSTSRSTSIPSLLGNILESFNHIKLVYDAQWPTSIILNDRAIEVYNGVFLFFMKVKYTKWLLETLHFSQLAGFELDPTSYHYMLLLRLHMLFVFTGLHDFLAHRVESLRIRIVQNWGLPDVLESQEPRSDPASSDLGQLIRDHESTLSDLESICLLTESSSMLRNEINNLCHMSLTFQSLWSQCRSYSDLLPRLVDLGSAFHNHIKFLAQLLFRAVRISNARRLLPLAETFIIASSFTYPPAHHHLILMSSVIPEEAFSAECRSSISSTPCRSVNIESSPTGLLKKNMRKKSALPSSSAVVCQREHLRRSLIRDSLRHSFVSKRAIWTSHRTSRLFELLTRPALLFTPSLGIRSTFSLLGSGHERHNHLRLSMRKRGQPFDPDPCLLSVDGLLDCLFATSNLVDQIYHDCKENEEDQTEAAGYEQSPTLLAAGFFRKRIKPALTRLSDLRIKLSDFKLGKFIGRGACGVVRVVHEVAPPRSVYAMKSQYKGAWLHHDPEGAQLMLERTVLAQATATENPWLPHLHYAFQDEKHLHLVMDYEPGGDLYIFLTKVGHLLDADMISFYAAEAIEATHSLHRMGYIHCDLKPENFAIERSGHLKLLDFGSAIRLDSDGRCICPTMVGTKEYLNIELLRQRGRHNEEPLLVGPEYDYWAIGVLLYELFYSHTPFYDEDEDAMMQKIMDYKRTLRFPSGIDIPEDAVHLIRSLITTPSKRLTYEGLVRHSFFKNIDFATLRQTTPPYLPPVGDLDDVSNFSGGGDRRRDEAIMDVSTNHTFSPVRGKDSCPGSLHRSTMGEASRASVDDTVLPNVSAPKNMSVSTEAAADDPNSRLSEPSTETQQPLLTEKELKELAIREAAAIPIHEEIEAIEDIEWDGSDCVRNLPFIGYTFTPGLVLLRKLTGAQTAATVAAGMGTNLLSASTTVAVDTSMNKPHPTPAHKSIARSSTVSVLDTLSDKENQPTGIPPQSHSELTQKLAQLQQLHDDLELRVKQPSPEHSEQAKRAQERLARAVENSSDLAACSDAIQAALSSILSRERRIFDHLVNQLERLHEENSRLSAAANEDLRNRVLMDSARLNQLTHLETQLERLRVNNSQLLTQRDEANDQVRELNAALARERELGEVTQQASESEIFRLTTITKQQGKLIDHMCSFLPPEHRPVGNLTGEPFTLIRDRSQVHGKLSTVKSLGHRAFKTGARRNGGGLTTIDSSAANSGSGGAPLLAAASAFFSRRRMVTPTETAKPDGHSESTPHTLIKQPSRLQRFVRKSGLRFKRRTVISPRPFANGATQSDQIFTDDDDDGEHNDGTLGYYSSGSANDFDDLDNGLPIHVPDDRRTLLPTADDLSTEDSISSGPSTTSSAPSGPIHHPEFKSSWPRLRSKTRVGWAKGAHEIQFTSSSTIAKHRSHPRLLKQLSKVLGKSKPSSGISANAPHH